MGRKADVRQPTPSDLELYATVAKAIADPTRLRILQLIGSRNEFACTALEQQLPVGKSTISHHIKVLSHAGLIGVRREGKYFHYALRRDVVDYYFPDLLARI